MTTDENTMGEYTPTTGDVLEAWVAHQGHDQLTALDLVDGYDSFNRWLAAEKAKWQAEAWEEGHRHRPRRGPSGCTCAAWSEGECACGQFGNGELWSLGDNPYKKGSDDGR